jgi:hypothetical protein
MLIHRRKQKNPRAPRGATGQENGQGSTRQRNKPGEHGDVSSPGKQKNPRAPKGATGQENGQGSEKDLVPTRKGHAHVRWEITYN